MDCWSTCWCSVAFLSRLVDSARGSTLDTLVYISVFRLLIHIETISSTAVDRVLPFNCVKGSIRSVSEAKLDARVFRAIGRLYPLDEQLQILLLAYKYILINSIIFHNQFVKVVFLRSYINESIFSLIIHETVTRNLNDLLPYARSTTQPLGMRSSF